MSSAQRSTYRVISGFLLLLLSAPLALAFVGYGHRLEAQWISELGRSRAETTRLQQSTRLLSSFSQLSQTDTELQAVFQTQTQADNAWQSPLLRTRLQLLDAASESVRLERLDDSSVERSADESQWMTERFWLSAKVLNVPNGIALLETLSDSVAPYPLRALGCRYQPSQSDDHLDMACLLVLKAIELPVLRPITVGDENSIQSERNAATSVTPAPMEPWTLFKSNSLKNQVASNVLVNAKPNQNSQQKPVQTISVITGPLGVVVLDDH